MSCGKLTARSRSTISSFRADAQVDVYSAQTHDKPIQGKEGVKVASKQPESCVILVHLEWQTFLNHKAQNEQLSGTISICPQCVCDPLQILDPSLRTSWSRQQVVVVIVRCSYVLSPKEDNVVFWLSCCCFTVCSKLRGNSRLWCTESNPSGFDKRKP